MCTNPSICIPRIESDINRQNINNQDTKIQDDYNECLKIIFSMCCLLIFIFLIALIVTLIIVYG